MRNILNNAIIGNMIANFSTQEEIVKKLRSIAKVHDFEVVHKISAVFYDVLKISYYALQRKKEGLNRTSLFPVTLATSEITKLFKLIHYHHSQNHVYTARDELTCCFGPNFTEQDALSYFEKNVERGLEDKFGRKIAIDLENGVKYHKYLYTHGRIGSRTHVYQPI